MARLFWTQKENAGPAPRSSSATAYDAANRTVVLYGGASSNARLGDTWQWDGQNWTQLSNKGPSARAAHCMAYDTDRQRTVLFGGADATSAALSDTWEWDGDVWTQVADIGPPARRSSAMTFNSTTQRVVLFGGQGFDPVGRDQLFGDTWAWDGGAWTQFDQDGPVRYAHAMAYDAGRDRLAVFGGIGATVSGTFGDTWEWNGLAWDQVADFGPAARSHHAMVFDGTRMVVFGGRGSESSGFNDTWGWDGRGWTLLQDMGPRKRVDPSLAWDSTRSCVVLYGGGLNTEFYGDTWELAAASVPA